MSWAGAAAAAVNKNPENKTHNDTIEEQLKRSEESLSLKVNNESVIQSQSDKINHMKDASIPVGRERENISRILSGSTYNSSQHMKKMRDEDDGKGWVGMNNISTVKASGSGFGGQMLNISPLKETKTITAQSMLENAKVACVTTDFSLQNVLIQIGLRVMSMDGMLIRSVKQWVLRCMACYTIHYEMDRLFCSRCGINHMSRVACSIDATTGKLKLHLRKDYVVSTKGTKYSLPKPGKQGRYDGEILLREDQLLSGIWRQKCVKIRKDVRSIFGEDVTSDLGMHINKSDQLKIGLGKQNPNALKGRERRGKSKKKN
jgi:RNA-binding protein NOB1